MRGKYDKAKEATDYNIIRRTCSERWINKHTKTCSEYVMLISFLWEKKWLWERALVLRLYVPYATSHTYITKINH